MTASPACPGSATGGSCQGLLHGERFVPATEGVRLQLELVPPVVACEVKTNQPVFEEAVRQATVKKPSIIDKERPCLQIKNSGGRLCRLIGPGH